MGSRRRSTHRRSARRPPGTARLVLLAGIATVMGAIVTGCGASGRDSGSDSGAPASAAQRGTAAEAIEERHAALERSGTHERRVAYLDRVRDAVVRGAGRDFAYGRVRDRMVHRAGRDPAIGTGVGGPSFEACVKGLLWEALDGPTIANLVAVYRRPHGVAYAAQALNLLAAPLAASCGHRSWVPELIEAARGLRSGQPIGAATEKLGVTYGPYLGKRCRHEAYPSCELIGIDVVFGHAADRVEAVIGQEAIRLHTPGEHNGITYRDWVGTFTHTGLARDHRSANRGGDLLYTGVELRVTFATGRTTGALFPHVLVSPGWG